MRKKPDLGQLYKNILLNTEKVNTIFVGSGGLNPDHNGGAIFNINKRGQDLEQSLNKELKKGNKFNLLSFI